MTQGGTQPLLGAIQGNVGALLIGKLSLPSTLTAGQRKEIHITSTHLETLLQNADVLTLGLSKVNLLGVTESKEILNRDRKQTCFQTQAMIIEVSLKPVRLVSSASGQPAGTSRTPLMRPFSTVPPDCKILSFS